MRVLWALYNPVGIAGEIIENVRSQSGTWIDAMVSRMVEGEGIPFVLGMACIASKNIRIDCAKTGITFYGISSVNRKIGKRPPKAEVGEWKRVIDDFQPDIIQVWGTEYSNGLSILEAAGDIPVLFFIQGVVGRIEKYPRGLLGFRDIKKLLGPISLVKFLHFSNTQRMLKRQKGIELEMVARSSGIITDNDWATSYYRTKLDKVNCYRVSLPINKMFTEAELSKRTTKRNTLFSIDLCNPAKGVFQLIRAIAIVKKKYPGVKLYVPGRLSTRKPGLIFESPYLTYLKRMIKKLGLENNITFCGTLSSDEMKEQLMSCHIFVMPSSIENHSASLREAMYVGCPCVTALVGGIAEYVNHGDNALTYRYGEEDMLADNIIRILDDDFFSDRLSRNAYNSIRQKYPMNRIKSDIISVYDEIVKSKE